MEDLINFITKHYDLAAMGGVLTFLTILYTFYNQVAVPMYNSTLRPVVQFFSSIKESPERLNNLDGKIDLILSELKPNSGTSIKDVINRLDAKFSLAEDQRLLLLNEHNNGVWVSNQYGQYTWTNDTLLKKVKAKVADDLKGENWINCVHPSDRKMVMDEWDSAVENKRDFNLHYRLIDMETQVPFNVHAIAKPAKDYKGTLVGFNGVVYFL